LTERSKSLEQALEDAVSRALRDNLAPLQRTADELHQAYADLVAACSSSRPTNALPAMLRAQTAASALAAGLSVLSNFVTVALNPRERSVGDENAGEVAIAAVEAELEAEPAVESSTGIEPEVETREPESADARAESAVHVAPIELTWSQEPETPAEVVVAQEGGADDGAVAEPPAFDLAALPADLRDLHRRASRNAKVAMQDIQLLRPEQVRLGRENNDICHRLRGDLDKARKEYDRRFRAIQDHPVDYFHHWMVEILAKGKSDALGEYPYPSPVLRH
jgi:hypothetical protein